MDIRIVNSVTLRVKTPDGSVYHNQDNYPWTILGLFMQYGGEFVNENGPYLKLGQTYIKLDYA